MRQDIDTALAAGFDDYVTKPFALQRLAQMIQRYRTMAGGSG
jgi:CheY-like chemotaxis protein